MNLIEFLIQLRDDLIALMRNNFKLYLPISGGTIVQEVPPGVDPSDYESGDGDTPLNVQSLDDNTYIGFYQYGGTFLGKIGFTDGGKVRVKFGENSQSTSNQTYDLIHAGNFNTQYEFSTTDLEAGVSSLETGKLYFVYEEE